jgi:hypothetical protein
MGLLALWALHQLKLDLSAWLQGLETLHVDGTEVNKNIRSTAHGLYEAKTLAVAEPLDRTFVHF